MKKLVRKHGPLDFTKDGSQGRGWLYPERNPMSIPWLTEFVGDLAASTRYLALSYNQADNYVKTQKSTDSEGDIDWRWEEFRERRTRRTGELQALVPHVRRLTAHVNQVRDGGRTLDLQLVGNVVAVLVGAFVMHPDPLNDDFPLWDLPVSGYLMRYLVSQLRQVSREVSPTFCDTLARQSDFIHRYNKAVTLGELRDMFRSNERERRYLARGEDALMADFMRLSTRLKTTLSIEDFALLKKFGNLFDWHARIEAQE